jgi:hypothetical protein
MRFMDRCHARDNRRHERKEGDVMFSFRLNRIEIAVLGFVAVVAAIWVAWLVKTTGMFQF